MPKKSIKKKAVKKVSKTKKPVKTKSPKTVKIRAVKETKKQIGTITHFYNHINVAVVLLIDTIKEGDTISIEGETTNFKQKVSSMQIDMKPIKIAVKGQEIGLKVKDRARTHDIIYKIE